MDNILSNISEKLDESVTKCIVCRMKYNRFLKFIDNAKLSSFMKEKNSDILNFLAQSERAYVIRSHELMKLRDEYI